MSAGLPLEPSADELARLAEEAVRRVVQHIASLPAQAADGTEGAAALARALVEREPPEEGTAAGPLLDLLFERAVPASFNNAGPGFMAYIPGGGQPYAAVGDFIAAGVNRYTGVFAPAPALVQLETNVVRWFARAIGYPATAGGFLASGGSLANFSAVVAASARGRSSPASPRRASARSPQAPTSACASTRSSVSSRKTGPGA